jgi:beta-mannosidase
MKFSIFFACLLLVLSTANGQSILLEKGWKFRQQGQTKWYPAEVPGTVHTDLLRNRLIPDPYYRNNEAQVQWVEKADWEYADSFSVPSAFLQKKEIRLVFDGLDTDAEVFLNGHFIFSADNMFRSWTAEVSKTLKAGKNLLLVRFHSSSSKAQQKKAIDKPVLPENERAYVRKAQYQFGWDWGPRLVTCGIWKSVRLESGPEKEPAPANDGWKIRLVQERDSIGASFYFTVNGRRTYIKGANWIPADHLVPRAKKLKLYEKLIKAAAEAHINMLRVWGGGIYEDDEFYTLCERYGIMVWQDFMFAGTLYPGDSAFLKNVEAEVRYQVKRLRSHPCIALWCGNNEIDEAWNNWGWQQQFGYDSNDSIKLWNNYKNIFHQLIPGIIRELDPVRAYWPSSPSTGWGRDSAYLKGDVHYWGVWWGKEPVEKYREKTGRFVSEYGMQGLPSMSTIRAFALPSDLDTASAVMKAHQKHPFGYENIRLYINEKFPSPKTFEDLVYVSQLMQADAIRTAIFAHRSNPKNSGTLFWQWNDCWPVVSWSAVDYYGRKKALYYEVKRDFEEMLLTTRTTADRIYFHLAGQSEGMNDSFRVKLNVGYFAGGPYLPPADVFYKAHDSLKMDQLAMNKIKFDPSEVFVTCSAIDKRGHVITEQVLFLKDPKDLKLPKASVKAKFLPGHTIEVSCDVFAYGVCLDPGDGVELDDNFFHILPGTKKLVHYRSGLSVETIRKNLRIKSLSDTYEP